MSRTILTALALLLLFTPALARSADAPPGQDTGFRIGLYGGVLITDPKETIGTGPTAGIRIGYQFTRVFAFEGNLGYSQALTRYTGRLGRALTPRLDLLFHIPNKSLVTPFFVVGPGLIWKKTTRDASVQADTTNSEGYGQFKNPETDFLVNAGVGVWIGFSRDLPLALRFDARWLGNIGAEPHGGRAIDFFHDFEITASLAARFGKRAPQDTDGDGYIDPEDDCPEVAEDFDGFEDEDGCPDLDDDRDGIEDEFDSCPDDPEDYDDFRDDDGCPEPDNDKDGVLDEDDDCPLDPGPVETHGCPDRDGDRVPDYRDECPDEPADPRVDPARSDGCPAKVIVTEEEVVILDKVHFEYNRDVIKTVSYEILDEVAEVLDKYPSIQRVEVQGHTDSDGSDSYNLNLSQRRAEAVVEYLVDKGIERARLEAKGYGESQPIDTNDTDEGMANNRRVQFVILEQ